MSEIIRDNSKRAKTLTIVFWSLTIITAIGVISGYFEIILLENALNGNYISEIEANNSDLRQGIIGIAQTILYITSVVVFLNWFRRAYGNLHRIGVKGLQYSESMSVWSFFIPIIFLYRPYKIMREIWEKTQEKIKQINIDYKIKDDGILIIAWWFLFVISNFVGKYVMRTSFKSETIEQLIEGSQAMLISDVIQVIEGLLVILIVNKISKIETILKREFDTENTKISLKKLDEAH